MTMVAQMHGTVKKTCTRCDKTKAISEYSIHGVSKTPMKICTDCFAESISKGFKSNKTTTPNRITRTYKKRKTGITGGVTKTEIKQVLALLSTVNSSGSPEVSSFLGATNKRTGYVLKDMKHKKLISETKHTIKLGPASTSLTRWEISEQAKHMMELLG